MVVAVARAVTVALRPQATPVVAALVVRVAPVAVVAAVSQPRAKPMALQVAAAAAVEPVARVAT
jgi:hypothetical protein